MKEDKELAKKRRKIAFRFHEGSGINERNPSIIWKLYDIVHAPEISLADGKRVIRAKGKSSANADKSYSSGVAAETSALTTLPGNRTFTGKAKTIGRGLLKSEFAQDFDGTSFPKLYNFSWDRNITMALGKGRKENALAAVTTIADMQDHYDVFLMRMATEPTEESLESYQDATPLIIKQNNNIWIYWRDLDGNMQLAQSRQLGKYQGLKFPVTVNKPIGPTTISSALYKNSQKPVFLMKVTKEPILQNLKKYQDLTPLVIKKSDNEIWIYSQNADGEMSLEKSKQPEKYDNLKFPNIKDKPIGPKIILGEVYKKPSQPIFLMKMENEPTIDNLKESDSKTPLIIKHKNNIWIYSPGSLTKATQPERYGALNFPAENNKPIGPKTIKGELYPKKPAAEITAAAELIYQDLADNLQDATPRAYDKALLMGWSRGGITCIDDANMLFEIGYDKPIRLFLIDPVAGNGVGDTEAMIRRLPPNSKTKILLTKGDRTKEFEPQDISRLMKTFRRIGPNEIMTETGAKVEFIISNGTHSQVAGCPKENPANPTCASAKITWYYVNQWLNQALDEKERQEFIGDRLKNIIPDEDHIPSDDEMVELFAETEVEFHKYNYILNPFKTRSDIVYTKKIRDFVQDLHFYVDKPGFFVNNTHEALFRQKYPELYEKYIQNPGKLDKMSDLDGMEPYSKKLLIIGILLRDTDKEIHELYLKEQELKEDDRIKHAAIRKLKLSLMELREAAAISIAKRIDELDSAESQIHENDNILITESDIPSDDERNLESPKTIDPTIHTTDSQDKSSEAKESSISSVDKVIEDDREEDPKPSQKSDTGKYISELENLPLVQTCKEAANLIKNIPSKNKDDNNKSVEEFCKKNIAQTQNKGLIRRFGEACLHFILTVVIFGPVGYELANKICGFFNHDVVKHQTNIATAANRVVAQNR